MPRKLCMYCKKRKATIGDCCTNTPRWNVFVQMPWADECRGQVSGRSEGSAIKLAKRVYGVTQCRVVKVVDPRKAQEERGR